MAGRRRTILLAMLALAAPLPAFAISDSSNQPVDPAGPASISVSASLDSCGVLDTKVVCKLDVSFSTLANADSYSASVTSADGSVVDYGSVPAGGTSFWVPYVGAGTYTVRITAYGTPETPSEPDAQGNVIATGDSGSLSDHPAQPPQAPNHDNETSASGADPSAGQNTDAGGSTDSQVAPAPGTDPAPVCTTPTTPTAEPPPTAPVPPPPDTDPSNPDEDADGIPDADEQAAYDTELAAYQAAVAAQQAAVTPAPAPGC